MWTELDVKAIEFSKDIQNLCKVPFYCHPKGCPNYGKKEKGCPPQPLIDKILNFNSKIYVIYTKFPVGKFAKKMRKYHPKWSLRQMYNPMWWQVSANSKQREEEKRFLQEVDGSAKIVQSPEAHGINITALMKGIGIDLKWQWPPKHRLKNKTYRVSLAGQRRRR